MSDSKLTDEALQSAWDAQWGEDGIGPWDISAEIYEKPLAPEDLLELIESGFKHGAVWGFKAGATRKFTDKEVEEVAKAIAEHHFGEDIWKQLEPFNKSEWFAQAKAALRAAWHEVPE